MFLPKGLTQFSHLTALQDSLFIHSWLGLGAHHMDLLLKNTLVAEAGEGTAAVANPCSFPGSTETVTGRSLGRPSCGARPTHHPGGGGGAYLGRQGGPTLPLGVPYRCLGRTGTGSFARCLERVQEQLEAKTRGGKVAPALLFPEYIPCWAAGAGTGRRCHRGWALQHFPGVQPRPTSFLGPPE